MMRKRYAFLALAGVLVVASCGGADQEETVVVQEDAAAAGMESGHADMSGATGGMPGGISTTEGVENPHAEAVSSMPGRDGVTQIMFKCADDKVFMFALLEGVEKARITVDGESYELDKIPSASGMKFSDGTWSFFGKGPEALVMKNDEKVFTDCNAAGHP